MNLFLILLFMPVMTPAGAENNEGKFRIYCFDTNVPTQALARYEYDNTWLNFLKEADLTKASTVLDDKDIETYDWEKQEVRLTDAGAAKLEQLEKKNRFLSHLKFIVTLDTRRLYAGEFLTRMSAMAIRHPVIHYDVERITGGKILGIFPSHIIGFFSEFPAEFQARTATTEVRLYFKSIAKLK